MAHLGVVFGSGVTLGTFSTSACAMSDLPLLKPLVLVAVTAFFVAAFRFGVASRASFATTAAMDSFVTAASLATAATLAAFGVASRAFSTSAYAMMHPQPSKPPDPVASAAFFVVMFGFGGGATAFLASDCIVVGPPPLKLRTCSTVAFLGTFYLTDGGPPLEVPSL
jgi:hypothetical protein